MFQDGRCSIDLLIGKSKVLQESFVSLAASQAAQFLRKVSQRGDSTSHNFVTKPFYTNSQLLCSKSSSLPIDAFVRAMESAVLPVYFLEVFLSRLASPSVDLLRRERDNRDELFAVAKKVWEPQSTRS